MLVEPKSPDSTEWQHYEHLEEDEGADPPGVYLADEGMCGGADDLAQTVLDQRKKTPSTWDRLRPEPELIPWRRGSASAAAAYCVTDGACAVPFGVHNRIQEESTVETIDMAAGLVWCEGAFVERTARGSAAESLQQVQRLRAMAADMVVELQRADGKATAVCGASGGFLTAGVALLAGFRAAPWTSVTALLSASVLLAVAVGVALWALRPVLPQVGSPGALLGVGRGVDIGPVVASIAELSAAEQLRLEEKRLAVIAGLARRKFQAVRVAVDLIVAALAMAVIGLLIPYMVG